MAKHLISNHIAPKQSQSTLYKHMEEK